MQNLRRGSQAVFLLLFMFLFLQTESTGRDELGYPVKIFLDFDPLILITTLLSAHTVEKAFYLSLIMIVITLVIGRVFCGWVCPLGTLNNMVSSLRKAKWARSPRNWHRVKYLVLIFILASSLFGLQLVGIMDPLSLLIRSFSVSVYPALSYSISGFFDLLYKSDIPGVISISDEVFSLLKKSILPFFQPSYLQSAFIGGIFLFILGLNLVENRFWCRYLCPLGALLGLLSRFSLLKRSVSEGCTSCGACAGVCQGNASPDRRGGWRDSECYYCWNCDDICPENAVSFGFKVKKAAAAMDLGRRNVIIAGLSGIVAVPLLRQNPFARADNVNPLLIRPPGALAEADFLKRCVKCGECMKVCITNGLQPTFLEAGFEGIWSPMLVPRIGYCEYRCTLCGQVCPTGAIKRLPLEEKVKVKIGLAMIDKGRCLPYAHATPCMYAKRSVQRPKRRSGLKKPKSKTGRERNSYLSSRGLT